MSIDPNKKYQTRDGRNVRILCADMDRARQPVVGIIEGNSYVNYWTEAGFYALDGTESIRDLIEVREPREWRIYAHPISGLIATYYFDGAEFIRVREVIE